MGETVPIRGVDVYAGQVEAVDDDGVSTHPIISLHLHGPDVGFAMPAELGLGLAETIKTQSRLAIEHYYSPREVEERERRARRGRRQAIAIVVTFVGVFAAMSGWAESSTYQHVGGVAAGVVGGIGAAFQLFGMGVVCFAAIAALRQRRKRRHD